ncbi:alpha/beta fold hydrolase [Nonomuraea soli]|uniref:Pimeloyl-ACP methyl ester carboxylesterase n=1 Tax=Nonomuraea soli TaxID=1032476 RepID=A0A7W0HRK5_9ACTN|nr:alpha/beta hydrolase [Nonomuraea soli]MBA2893094.1 pimeloyl-ACP methyl ester carboxylesterase [Nonomuraea soli]
MTVRSQHRGLSLLIAALTLPLGLTAAVTPASASASAKPTVVLVHGVFADSSGWNETIARLQRAGFPVIAAANPLRDLDGDAAYVSSIIDTIPGPVIMVGHSYGGAAITNAARGHANVKALVYVAAFAPDKGETPLELAGKFPGSKLPPALVVRPYPGGKDGYIDPARFRDVFAADLPASQTRLMAATQRPGSVGGLSGHSGVPAWKSVPSWFVIPSKDNVIPPAVQRFMAKRAGGTITEVAGASHVVMMSRPDTVVRQIVAAHTATR